MTVTVQKECEEVAAFLQGRRLTAKQNRADTAAPSLGRIFDIKL